MKKFNPKSLPYLAAMAQSVQFGHAGYDLWGYVGIAIGAIVGTVVSFSVAYAGSQIASIRGQKRERWANIAAFLMILLSPLAIATPIYNTLTAIPQNLDWLRWATACAWALAPDLAIMLGGLVTGKGLVAEDKPEQLHQIAVTSDEQKAKAEKAVEKERQKPQMPSERLACKICGWNEATTKLQLAGHMRKHPIAKRVPEEIIWSCPRCNTINNSERNECRQCGSLRIAGNGSEKEKEKLK